MAGPNIRALTTDPALASVPSLTDYSNHSASWEETEFPIVAGASAVAGRWTGEPGWVEFDAWPYREFCVIVSGRVAVESRDGSELHEYGPGDAFMIPPGFCGRWVTVETTTKVFVGVHE